MDLLFLIEDAFSARHRPRTTTIENAPIDEMYEDALAFQGKTWQEVTCADLEKYRDAPLAFNPDAFCYFLPGIYSAGIREDRPDLLVNDDLIRTLDFSSPANWGDFFYERWAKLNAKECEATQHWLLWIASADLDHGSEAIYPRAYNPVSRAFDTINHLINQKKRSSLNEKNDQ